ncbi:MAG: HAD family phosphatase [Clostridiales bacterium]|nr:HAD family phosphatase [Clostridiales bacterium]
METIKLIAMDMDGTLLLDGGKGIPPGNVEALHAAHAAGIQLVLCSGRIPDDMGFYALDTGVPMHILALNGTCTLDTPLGVITNSAHIPVQAARDILHMLQEYPVAYGIFCDHDLLISIHLSDEQLKVIFGANVLREGGRTRITYRIEEADALIRQGVSKFMVFTDNDPEPLLQVRSRIEAEIPGVDVCSSWFNNLEINPSGASKGVALTALARRLGIPMSQVMAIGDNDNDLPMLEAAGVAVAMGNASPHAIAASDYLTLPNHECGVAAAIRAIALGESIPDVRRLP